MYLLPVRPHSPRLHPSDIGEPERTPSLGCWPDGPNASSRAHLVHCSHCAIQGGGSPNVALRASSRSPDFTSSLLLYTYSAPRPDRSSIWSWPWRNQCRTSESNDNSAFIHSNTAANLSCGPRTTWRRTTFRSESLCWARNPHRSCDRSTAPVRWTVLSSVATRGVSICGCRNVSSALQHLLLNTSRSSCNLENADLLKSHMAAICRADDLCRHPGLAESVSSRDQTDFKRELRMRELITLGCSGDLLSDKSKLFTGNLLLAIAARSNHVVSLLSLGQRPSSTYSFLLHMRFVLSSCCTRRWKP